MAVIIAFVCAYVLKRTKVGLHLRAVGESPNTADAAGINVNKYKYIATCAGCMIAGLGGLYYVMDYACGVWSNDAFGDRGWLAIAQVLMPMYEPQFSESSFGFRPKRGAHDALKQCRAYADDGYVYVVDMDLEKFFDTVCQSKLIEVLSRTVKDGRLVSLIHKYLNAGVIRKGIFERSEQGVPQGGPLSPLLSNIMLNELDKELERRGHKFVRYADDCMILCKSRRSAQRTLESITRYIEGKLFLKVNREKTHVAHIRYVKYLGYGFYRKNGKCRFKVHEKSLKKMKNRLREILNRRKATSNEDRPLLLKRFVKGWVNYFKLADMKQMLKSTDEWLRRKIRAIYWKQWKKIRTRYRMIRQYNIPEWKVHELANCRKGVWRAALMLNAVFSQQGGAFFVPVLQGPGGNHFRHGDIGAVTCADCPERVVRHPRHGSQKQGMVNG